MKRGVFLFIILGLILAGCASTSKADKQATNPALLEPQLTQKFSDLPIPAGFKLLPQNSYFFESSGVRVGMLRYRGKADADQVANFFKEQMPMFNWNLLNSIEYGERLLNFDRQTESCIIRLLPKGKTVMLTISLGPKSQISKKADNPVK